MKDADALRVEIAHLRSLAKLLTDPQTLAAVNEIIRELEDRLHRAGNGAGGEG
jgi:hypothetical protein